VRAFSNRMTRTDRLYAVGFCDAAQGRLVSTQAFPPDLNCKALDSFLARPTHLLPSAQGPLHVSVQKIEAEGESLGRLVLVHDMSFVQRRSEETKRYVFYFFIGLGAIVSMTTVIMGHRSRRGWEI